jgi:N-acetylneuraminic acid mutarotase
VTYSDFATKLGNTLDALTRASGTLDQYFQNAQAAVPFLGRQLEHVAEDSGLQGILDQIASKINSSQDNGDMQTKLFDLLGPPTSAYPNALNILAVESAAGLGSSPPSPAASDIYVTPLDNGSGVSVQMLLRKQVTFNANFDLGLPRFLSIQTNVGFQVTMDVDYLFQATYRANGTLTLADQNGVTASLSTINPSDPTLPATPLAFRLNVGLAPGTQFTATLNGLLYASVTDNGSTFDGTLGVDLDQYGNISSGGITLQGAGANLNMGLQLGFAPPTSDVTLNPQLKADLTGDWSFANGSSLTRSQDSFGSLGDVTFTDVRVELGTLVPGFLTNIISQIQTFTRPLAQVANILTTPVPGLSDIGINLDIASLLGGNLDSTLQTIQDINNFSATISGSGTIHLGNFSVSGEQSQSASPQEDQSHSSPSTDLQSQINGLSNNFFSLLDGVVPPNTSNDWSTGGLSPPWTTSADPSGLDFPLLTDPSTALQLLLGNDQVKLFSFNWSIPDQHFRFSIPIPVAGIAEIDLTFGITFGAGIDVGYDAEGLGKAVQETNPSLIPADILHGFYINTDVTHLTLQGDIGLSASVVVFQAEGDLVAQLTVGIDPTNNDPHTNIARLDTLENTFANDSDCLFALSGDIYVTLSASIGIEVPFVGFESLYTFDLGRIDLLQFNTDCSTNPTTAQDSSDTLTLNVHSGDTIHVSSYANLYPAGPNNPYGDPYTEYGIEVDDNGNPTFYPVYRAVHTTGYGGVILPDQDIPMRGTDNQIHPYTTIFASTNGCSSDTIIVDPLYQGDHNTNPNVVLLGGPGADHFENHGNGTSVLIGSGGSDALIGGQYEFADGLPEFLRGQGQISIDGHMQSFRDFYLNHIATLPTLPTDINNAILGYALLLDANGVVVGDNFGSSSEVSYLQGAPGLDDVLMGGKGTTYFSDPPLDSIDSPGTPRHNNYIGGSGTNVFQLNFRSQTNDQDFSYLYGGPGSNRVEVHSIPYGVPTFGHTSNQQTPNRILIYNASASNLRDNNHAFGLAGDIGITFVYDVSRLDLYVSGLITIDDPTGTDLTSINTDAADSITLDLPTSYFNFVTESGTVLSNGSAGVHINDDAKVGFFGSQVGSFDLVVTGLNAQATINLDGGGQGNLFNIQLDSLFNFTTDLSASGPGNAIVVDGSALPGDNPPFFFNQRRTTLNIDDNAVTSTCITTRFTGQQSTLTAEVRYHNMAAPLRVVGPNFGAAITLNRPDANGDTSIQGGDGDNTITINQASRTVNITAGSGTNPGDTGNHIHVDPNARTFANINVNSGGTTTFTDIPLVLFALGAVSVTGGSLTIDDPIDSPADAFENDYVLESGDVSVFRPAGPITFSDRVQFSGLSGLTLNTGATNVNSVQVDNVNGFNANVIANGLQSNLVTVTPNSQNIGDILGTLTVTGDGPGRTDIVIDDQNNTNETAYTVGPTSVSRPSGGSATGSGGITVSSPNTIAFSNIDSLTLNAASSPDVADTFTIQSPQALQTTISDMSVPRDTSPTGPGLDSVDINGLAGALELSVYGSPHLHGTPELSYATIKALAGLTPTLDSPPITILDDDGSYPVTGTFDGLSAGTPFTTADGVKLQVVTYGGNGLYDTQVSFMGYLNDAPLTVYGVNPKPIEGTSFSGVVGSFLDADPSGQPGDYLATITWGDGAQTTGTVTANGLIGGFDVSGTHPYPYYEEGGYTVVVTVQDLLSGVVGANQGSMAIEPMTVNRYAPAASFGLDGKLYVFGGDSAGVTGSGEVYDPASGTWSSNLPDMPTPRFQAATTLGQDGKIYVIGGAIVNGVTLAVGTVEAYDPASQTWTSLPSLHMPRYGAVAATGPDGTLYVFGGYGQGQYLDSVESYSPGALAWTTVTTTTMPVPLAFAAATMGPGDWLYFIGGQNTSLLSPYLNTVYAYNLVSGQWITLANLPAPLGQASAAFGPDGRIYVFGGATGPGDEGATVNTVQAYEPNTGIWKPAEPLRAARSGASALAGPDGRIYLVGGAALSAFPAWEEVYTVGTSVAVADAPLTVTVQDPNFTAGVPFSNVVGFFTDADPGAVPSDYTATISWGDGTSSPGTVAYSGVGTLFYVFGSHTYAVEGQYLLGLTVADQGGAASVNDTATSLASLMTVGSMAAAENFGGDGKFYVFGWYNSNGVLDTGEVYDPTTDTWSGNVPAMPTPQFEPATTRGADGKIYLIGGIDQTSFPTSTVQAYDPSSQTWTSLPGLNPARSQAMAATGPDGTLYVFGGVDANGNYLNSVEALNLEALSIGEVSSWANLPAMPVPLANAAVAIGPDGLLYFFGGQTGLRSFINTVYAFNFTTRQWKTIGAAKFPLAGATAALGRDGRIYLFGDPGVSNNVEAYDPVFNSWSEATPPAAGGAAFTGLDGQIYIFGNGFSVSGGFSGVFSLEAYNVGTLVSVADAPLTFIIRNSLNMTEGTSFSGVVGTFFDADPSGVASEYVATISWGDGSSSEGTVSSNGQGGFDVSGSHTYVEDGSYVLDLSVGDLGGAVANNASSLLLSPMLSASSEGAVNSAVSFGSDGRLYVFGSVTPYGITGNGEVYDPATDSWSSDVPAMPTARVEAATTLGPDGQIYVIGGLDQTRTALSTVEAFNPASQGWTTGLPGVSIARYGAVAATGPDGTLYVFGGVDANGNYLDSVEALNPKALSSGEVPLWTSLPAMPAAFANAAGTVSGGWLYLFGGTDSFGYLKTAYAYNFATRQWLTLRSLPYSLAFAAAAPGPDGRLYLFGGATYSGDNNAVAAYDPTTNRWSPANPLQASRQGAAAVTGLGGVIYVIGGDDFVGGNINLPPPEAYIVGTPATVADGPLTAVGAGASIQSDAGVVGPAFNLGSFTDANSAAAASDYTATIYWGDGQVSAGTIVPNQNGGFDVSSAYTYAAAGIYAIDVHVADIGGAALDIAASAQVASVGSAGTNLTIQGGSPVGNTITIDNTAAGTQVTVNGTSYSYGPGVIQSFTVNLGRSVNTLNILELAVPLTFNGHGVDVVNIGSATQTLDPIQGPVTINGNGNTTLNVNDQGTTTNQGYLVFATEVDRNGVDAQGNTVPDMAPIIYYNIQHLVVHAGSGQFNSLIVESTSAGTTTDVYGGANNPQAPYTDDIFNVIGPPGDDLDQILGPLNLHGQPSTLCPLIFNDSSTSAQTYTVTAGALYRTGIAPITFDGMYYENLITSEFARAVVNVQSTAENLPWYIGAQYPTDSVTVGYLDPTIGWTLANIQGPVTVDGYGTPSLTINDQGTSANENWIVTSSSIDRYPSGSTEPAVPLVTYNNLGTVTVNTGTGQNVIGVEGTSAGTSYTINDGAGGDSVNIGDANNSLGDIAGAVAVNGQGNTTLNVNDQGGHSGAASNQGFAYSLAQYSFSRTGTELVTWSGIGALNLNMANAGSNAFNDLVVASTAPGTTYSVYAGTGVNELFAYDYGDFTLNGIQGPLFIHGTGGSLPNDDLVGFYDVDRTTRHTIFLNAGASPQSGIVTRQNSATGLPDMAPINYDGINAYSVLYTNGGQDTIDVQSQASDFGSFVSVGTGETVNIGDASHTLNAFQGYLDIEGTGQTPVYVDDSADSSPQPIDLQGATPITYQVSGLMPSSSGLGQLYFELDPTAPVSINTGARNFHLHDLMAAPALSLSAVGGSLDTGTSGLAGNFDHTLSLANFSTVSMHILGDMSGSLLASTEGTATNPIGPFTIDGSIDAGARIKVNYLSSLSVGGDLAGVVYGYGNSGSQSQPTIGPITIGGNFTGTITAPIMQSINMQPASDFAGQASETEPGVDFQNLVLGTVTSAGVINAGAIQNATIAGDMDGQINDSGPLDTMTVGGNLTGTVSAATIGAVTVAGTLTGQVTASQSLGVVTAAGKPVAQGIFLLDPSISAALNVSGTAHITIPGSIFVDSTSPTAITAGGSAQVTAAGIQVVGGVQRSASATLSPNPVTGVAAFLDPMAFLSGPSTAGLTNYGPVNYSSGSHTLQPGIYSQINASGSASLTLSPGMYIIEGGGLTVTRGASITGAGVTIYNTGSNYPNAGGTYGGITLSGNGSFNLTPATSAAGGADPGIVIYQSRSNTRALALSNNAGAGLTGMVYAPSAAVVIGGTATLNAALVVDRLQVSGKGASTQVIAGSTGDNSASPDTLLAGDLEVYVDDSSGDFTADELARIQDAINTWDGLLAPYNVQISEVSDPSLANVLIDTGATSAAGSAADGILGCFNGANNEITILQGWNWYDGSDPTQIGPGQYDFQTVVTHELGHALGLGGSADPNSPMYETLAAGVVLRTPTVADLNISDPPEGADPQRAALLPSSESARATPSFFTIVMGEAPTAISFGQQATSLRFFTEPEATNNTTPLSGAVFPDSSSQLSRSWDLNLRSSQHDGSIGALGTGLGEFLASAGRQDTSTQAATIAIPGENRAAAVSRVLEAWSSYANTRLLACLESNRFAKHGSPSSDSDLSWVENTSEAAQIADFVFAGLALAGMASSPTSFPASHSNSVNDRETVSARKHLNFGESCAV